MVQSSLVTDAGGISRTEAESSGDDETCAINCGPSTTPVSSSSSTDDGSLSTLAMIILSYNKNDARLAIDNVRQGTVSVLSNQRVGAVVQLVEYRTRNQEVAGSTHTRSTASNLEQVANLMCAQANSASYPQRDGK